MTDRVEAMTVQDLAYSRLARPRSEDDDMPVPTPTMGAAEAHAFLYVPDLAARMGWSTHRVPERTPERKQSRAVGFRHQEENRWQR